jgi:hypothetical protein
MSAKARHPSPASTKAGDLSPAGNRTGEGVESLLPYLGTAQTSFEDEASVGLTGADAAKFLLDWHTRTRLLEDILKRAHSDDFPDWLTEIHRLSAECDALWVAYELAKKASPLDDGSSSAP